MASLAVRTAVDARINANWSATAYLGLNETGEPPDDKSPFLVTQYPTPGNGQQSVGAPGANVFRETGTIRFVLSIPRGTGVDYWQGVLEALLAKFQGAQFGGVKTWEVTPPRFDNTNDQGSYWLLTAIARFYFDTLG